MAIGDTVQAGLMRVDFSPIQRAGEAQARANQAFGQAIGGVIDKFYQKKKDKQEREEREQAYRQMGLSDEEAKAASRDKDLANQFINKMNADRNYDLQVDQFNQASQLRDLQMDQLRRNMERQKDADQLAKEEQEKTTNFLNYMAQPGPAQIDPSGPDRNSVLRNIRAGKGATPPARMVPGPSPAEQSVMSPQAKEFIRNARLQKQPMDKVLPMAKQIDQQIAQSQPKAPTPFEAKKYFDESINKMRKEYNSLDEVKAFKPVRAAFLKVKQSAEKPSAAGDLALVFNYMKILDPGSVVREGEFKTAADATAWLQKSEADGVSIPAPIAQAIRKLKDGTILTDAQRKDFVNIARKAASAQFAPVKDSYLQYRNIVNQMQLPEGLTLPDNYQMIEDELAGQIPIESSSNAIKTDQGNYSIEGLSVEAQ